MNIRQGAWKMGSRQSTILLLQIQRAFRALRKKESEFRIRPPLKESPSSHSCRKRATEGRRKASRGHPPCREQAPARSRRPRAERTFLYGGFRPGRATKKTGTPFCRLGATQPPAR